MTGHSEAPIGAISGAWIRAGEGRGTMSNYFGPEGEEEEGEEGEESAG